MYLKCQFKDQEALGQLSKSKYYNELILKLEIRIT